MKQMIAGFMFAGLLAWTPQIAAEEAHDLLSGIKLTEVQAPLFEAAMDDAAAKLTAAAEDRLALRAVILEMDEPVKEILEQAQWGAYLRYKQALVGGVLR